MAISEKGSHVLLHFVIKAFITKLLQTASCGKTLKHDKQAMGLGQPEKNQNLLVNYLSWVTQKSLFYYFNAIKCISFLPPPPLFSWRGQVPLAPMEKIPQLPFLSPPCLMILDAILPRHKVSQSL